MPSYPVFNRRKDGERRVCDISSELEHRHNDPRRHDSNSYLLVLGNGGMDGFSIACFIALLLIAMIVTLPL